MLSSLDAGVAVGGRVFSEAEVAVLDEARGVAFRSSHLAGTKDEPRLAERKREPLNIAKL